MLCFCYLACTYRKTGELTEDSGQIFSGVTQTILAPFNKPNCSFMHHAGCINCFLCGTHQTSCATSIKKRVDMLETNNRRAKKDIACLRPCQLCQLSLVNMNKNLGSILQYLLTTALDHNSIGALRSVDDTLSESQRLSV